MPKILSTAFARAMVATVAILASLACRPAGSDPRATPEPSDTLDARVARALDHAGRQLAVTASRIADSTRFPRSTDADGRWIMVPSSDWTSGFFAGSLWHMYARTRDPVWRRRAERWTGGLEREKLTTNHHDLGFILYTSFGAGRRLTGNDGYRDVLLTAAASLASRYSSRVGAIKSWDWSTEWQYPVIIDNLMNLELLFRAARESGRREWYDMAHRHALTTMRSHVRGDGSTYHVVDFDSVTGRVAATDTHQGFSRTSTWARGQAWGVYGFTMAYRETGDRRLLDAAQRVAEYFIEHLPHDGVPYWDFKAPHIPNEPKDASAAAIALSGLLELQAYAAGDGRARYRAAARRIMGALTAPPYLTEPGRNPALLRHAVGNRPGGTEVDVSLIYADYYFIEAMLRYERLKDGRPVIAAAVRHQADGDDEDAGVPRPDDAIFAHLDLDHAGLELVRQHHRAGDFTAARRELLLYFQTRTNRTFSGLPTTSDTAQAKLNAANTFVFRNARRAFGDRIDWSWVDVDKEWQFTLNRTDWFPNFAGVYRTTRDEAYAQAWMRQVESWLDGAPRPGYPRSIDTGRRLQHWTAAYHAFIRDTPSPSVTPEFHARLLHAMVQQAEVLYRPEQWRRYSNWGTFETSGLALVALMFPEVKRSEPWLREVWFRMRFQLRNSFTSDGMHVEASPSYHAHELEVWLDFLRLADENGVASPLRPQVPLSPDRSLLERPATALMHLHKPDGRLPQVGDTDDVDERPLLLALGRYLGRPDMTYVATGGRAGAPPRETSIAFPDGGHYVMRSGWGRERSPADELYLLFTTRSNHPWHAHHDILNVVVDAYGHELLKDPGRFTYNDDSPERAYFKSTAAHNTVTIDGEDQPRRYTPPPAVWRSTAGFDYVSGVQDGQPGVVHRRSVFFARPSYWIVVDRLENRGGRRRYDQHWRLSETALGRTALTELDGIERRVVSPHLLLFPLLDDATVRIEEGWISRRYRAKTPAPVVRASVETAESVTWPTVLYPYPRDPPAVRVERLEPIVQSPPAALTLAMGLRVRSDAGVDYFFEQRAGGPTHRLDRFTTDARAMFVRTDARGAIVYFDLVDGTFLSHGRTMLVRLEHGPGTVSSPRPEAARP